MRISFVASLGLLALAACAGEPADKGVVILSSPHADSALHREPVFFNGRHYEVTFGFNSQQVAYALTVAGDDGRALSAGDQALAEQIAISTLSHFACPAGRARPQIIAGSARFGGGVWALAGRC